jgi:hypothetical protein
MEHTFREYTLRCPCGKTTSGIGLIHHLHTKENWYRLHQKKCDVCRHVRFDKLNCVCLSDNFMTKSQKNSQKEEMLNTSEKLIRSFFPNPESEDAKLIAMLALR